MHASVLLLNADAQPLSMLPLSTISWQTAIKAMFGDKVRVIKNYENRFLRSSSLTIPLPSVVMMNRFHKHPTRAKFCRRNLYIRDKFCCQYCSNMFAAADLTIDHVIPKSKGGKLIWENTVAACGPCNVKKGDRPVKPITKPVKPTWYQINGAALHYDLYIPDMAWQDFLHWPEEKLHLAEIVTLG